LALAVVGKEERPFLHLALPPKETKEIHPWRIARQVVAVSANAGSVGGVEGGLMTLSCWGTERHGRALLLARRRIW